MSSDTKKQEFALRLTELIEKYEETRVQYRDFINRGDNYKITILEF